MAVYVDSSGRFDIFPVNFENRVIGNCILCVVDSPGKSYFVFREKWSLLLTDRINGKIRISIE